MNAAEVLRHSGRTLLGVLLGSYTALLDLAFVVCAGPLLLAGTALPGLRRLVFRCARQLTTLELSRLSRVGRRTEVSGFSDRAALKYLAVRWVVGLLGAVVLLLLLFGLGTGASMVSAWVAGGSWSFVEDEGGGISSPMMLAGLVSGSVLLYLDIMGLVGVGDLEVYTAHRFLGPSTADLLRRRVSELSTSRAEVVQAVNDERRRIERDLHDGVQQRLVALGLLLSRARNSGDTAKSADLVRQAHEESEQALHDLRDVAWRVYPTVLDKLGLHDVLIDVADRAGIPVTLAYQLRSRPPAATETVAYFVISEAVSNAVKHSGADRLEITVTPIGRPVQDAPESIAVMIVDNGRGGADPGGRGLTGLAGRVAATDGHFEVISPPGGPTTIWAELPCG